METEGKQDSRNSKYDVDIENQTSTLKNICLDLKNLGTLIIKKAESLGTKLEKENIDEESLGEYKSKAKDIVSSLLCSADNINYDLCSNLQKWRKEEPEESADVKPQIGSIKLVDLNKLLDPNRNSKPSKNAKEEDVVVIDDSSDSDPPVRKTRNKSAQKRKTTINNNKENLSDEDRSRKSILKTRRSNDKSPIKKVQFSDKDDEILSSIRGYIESSSESSDDSDESYKAAPKRTLRREKKKSEQKIKEITPLKTTIRECFVKLARIPAENLLDIYKESCKKKENQEIDRLCDLKSLKRARKTKSDSDLSDSSEKQVKKKKRKNSPRPKCHQRVVLESSDSDNGGSKDVEMPLEDPKDSFDEVANSFSPNKDIEESLAEDILDSINISDKEKNEDSDTSKDLEKDDETSSKTPSEAAENDKVDQTNSKKPSDDEDKNDKAPVENENLEKDTNEESKNDDPTDNDEKRSKKDKEGEKINDKKDEKEKKSDGKKKKIETDDSSEDEKTKSKKKKSLAETEESENDESESKNKDKKRNEENEKNKTTKDSSDDSNSEELLTKSNSSTKWKRNKLLTQNLSSTDSEKEKEKFVKKKAAIEKERNESNDSEDDTPISTRKVKRLKKKKIARVLTDSDSDEKNSEKDSSNSSSNSQAEDSSSSETEVKKDAEKKSHRRIKHVNDSSDDDDEDKTTRKQIRKVIGRDSLAESTKQAEKDEAARKARISDKQRKYNCIFEANKLESTTLSKVVLDFNEETEEELLQVDKEIVRHLKPHQGKGIQFMWDTCFESIERATTTVGSGCILAHCMGLGKTLQVISLIHSLLTHEKCGVKKVMVVCPLSTVLNWVAEFKKWIPEDDDRVDVFDLVAFKDNRQRVFQVNEWHKHGGVLVLGYDMFRNLSNDQNKRLTKKIRAEFARALIDPGPDLVVCDEGHLLKNEKTSISKSMNKLKTQRRIVLTGTPLQNNLKEYWCMVQFVKPNLLGTYKEYLNRFVNPITNGQYTDSTEFDISIMRKRSHVLHKLLDGIVQRRDYSVLAPFLPPKNEYVLFISLTKVQVEMYSHYLREFARKQTAKRGKSFLFTDFQEFQRICTHPRVMLNKSIQRRLQKEKEDFENDDESEGSLKDFIDDEDDETEASAKSSSNDNDSDDSVKSDKKKVYTRRTRAVAAQDPEGEVEEVVVVEQPSEWWRQYMKNDELDNIAYSGKLHLLFEILHQCELMGDKVLVFSQSLFSLTVIEYFLAKIDEASQNNDSSSVGGYMGSWSLGLDYFRLDGSSSCDNRATWCKVFNDPENTRARLFLISTRAGGLGINLVAANRVIIFDVSWNPSHDIQSIYRVYRFGQLKPTYVYRFVTLGTMEMKVYERQVTKQAISKRVIDEQQIDRHYNQNDLAELYKFEPKDEEERPIPLVPKDVLLGELLQNFKNLIFSYHEHQSLLENKEDEVLDEAERKAAWDEFENEKTARYNSTFNNAGAINSIPQETIKFALSSIIQREHPTFTPLEIQGVMPQLVAELTSQVALGDTTLFQKIVTELRLHQAQLQQQKINEYYKQQLMFSRAGGGGVVGAGAQSSGYVGNPFYQQAQQQHQMWMQQKKQNGQNSASSSSSNRTGLSQSGSKRLDPTEVVQIDD